MKTPLRRAIEIGVLLVVLTAGTLLYLFPEVPIQFLLSETLEHIGEAGIHVQIHHISAHSLLFSIEVPSLSLKLERINPQIRMSKLFPPSWEIHWKEGFEQINSSNLTLQSPNFDLSYEGTLFGQWVFHGEFTAENMALRDSLSAKSPKVQWNIRKGVADLKIESQIEKSRVEAEINTSFAHSESELLKTNGKIQWKIGDLQGSGPLAIAIHQEPIGVRVALTETQTLGLSALPYGLHLENVQVQGEETLSPDKTLEAKLTLKDRDNLFSGNADGKFSGTEKSGQFQFHLPLNFQKNLQPDHFLPELKGKLETLSGNLETAGKVTFRSGKIFETSLTAKTNGISGMVEKIPFRELIASLSIESDSRGTRGSHFLSLKTLGTDFTLENFHLRAEGPRRNKVTIKEFSGSLLGGRMAARPFVIDLKNREFSSEIELKALELEKIISLFASDKISGTGKMAGKIPLNYKNDYLTISDANLYNTEPGHLRYADETVSQVKGKVESLSEFNDLMHRGEQALVLKALDNFDYSLLRMSADRSRNEGLSLQIHLRGKNPDLAGGQPFELNLPISGNVESFFTESLLKSTMESEAWEEKLKKRIEDQ